MQINISTKQMILAAIIAMIVILIIFLARGFSSSEENSQTSPSLVETSKVVYEPYIMTVLAYGAIEFLPKDIKQLSLQNEVSVKQVFVSQGQQVKKGDPLIMLAPSASSNLNLENAKIAVKFAKEELMRISKLRDQYLATNAEVAAAQQNLDKSQANLQNIIKNQQHEKGKVINAQTDSTIINIAAQAGQVVSAGAVLLTYAENSTLKVRVGVENDEISKVKVGQQATIIPIYNTKKIYQGSVENITGQVDPKTGLVDVILALDSVENLLSGMIVKAFITVKTTNNVLTIPHSAILMQKGKTFVFVDMNGIAQKRNITILHDDGNVAHISEGLHVNETVVTKGNYTLENGSALQIEHKP